MRLLRTLSVLCLAIALPLAGLTFRPLQVDVVNGHQDGAGRNAPWIERRWVGEAPTGARWAQRASIGRRARGAPAPGYGEAVRRFP